MKKNFKRVMALSLATIATAAMPMSTAFAGSSSGSIASSFTIDSPVLTVTVPTEVKLHLNESFIGTTTLTNAGDYQKKSSVYSDPILISNATVSSDAKKAIPVVATLYATIKPGNGVKVLYDPAAVNENGTASDKSVCMDLIGESALGKSITGAAGTGDKYDLKGDGSAATLTGAVALAKDGGGVVAATTYGSMMQIAVAGPDISAAAGGQSKPIYGGFALAGKINTAANWTEDDLSVDLFYNVKSTNTAYDADANLAPVTGGFVAAADGSNHDVLKAIQAAEGLAAAPTTDVTVTSKKITIPAPAASGGLAKDVYLAIEDVDPTLTVTKFGFSFADETGTYMDFWTPDNEYKSANIYSAKKGAGTTDRVLYVNYSKDAASIKYMADLAKKQGKTTVAAKTLIVLSDASVVVQDIEFTATP